MARLLQTTNAKERVYSQAVSFFSTNEVVLTALSASFTGMFGLHEGTQTVEAMKEGVSRSLEDLAEIGGKVQEAAVKAGYGPTVRADAVKKLVDSVVTWQTRSRELIEEMRVQSTANQRKFELQLRKASATSHALPMKARGLWPALNDSGDVNKQRPGRRAATNQAAAGRSHAGYGRGRYTAPSATTRGAGIR